MGTVPLSVTPLYAGILALLYFGLSIYVILGRRDKLIGLGDGGDAEMLTRIRMHGNFAEFVPLCLVVMLILELGGSGAMLLHGMGIALVLGRIAHAYGLRVSSGATPYRAIGMVSAFAVLIIGGIGALLLGLGI